MIKYELVDYVKLQTDVLKEVFKKLDGRKHKDIIVGDYKSEVGYIINGHLIVIVPQAFNMLSLPKDYIAMSLDKLIPDLEDFKKATNYNSIVQIDKFNYRLIETDNILVKVNNDYMKYFNLDNEDFAIYIKDGKTPVIFYDEYKQQIIGLLMPVKLNEGK